MCRLFPGPIPVFVGLRGGLLEQRENAPMQYEANSTDKNYRVDAGTRTCGVASYTDPVMTQLSTAPRPCSLLCDYFTAKQT